LEQEETKMTVIPIPKLALPEWQLDYDSQISQEVWDEVIKTVTGNIQRACDLYTGYTTASEPNSLLLDIMEDEFTKAHQQLKALGDVLSPRDHANRHALSVFICGLAGIIEF
jgi:hypothetical protein